MAEETLPRSQAAFDSIMQVIGGISKFLLWTIFVFAGIALGFLAWSALFVQMDQVPHGNWGGLRFLFGALSIIGFIIACAVVFDDDDGGYDKLRAWCWVHFVIACIMWVVFGVSLLNAGRTITVPRDVVMVSTQGDVYFPGERIQRGYLHPRWSPITTAKTFDVELVRDVSLDEGAYVVRITRHVTFMVSVRDHPALEAMLHDVARRGGTQFDSKIWEYTDSYIGRFKKQVQSMPSIDTTATFSAPRPWMSQIKVLKVTENAMLVESPGTTTPSD